MNDTTETRESQELSKTIAKIESLPDEGDSVLYYGVGTGPLPNAFKLELFKLEDLQALAASHARQAEVIRELREVLTDAGVIFNHPCNADFYESVKNRVNTALKAAVLERCKGEI